MKMSGLYAIEADREKVFSAITDPVVLQRSIPGCERLVKAGPDSYDAHLKLGLAGIKGSYTGKVRLKDLQAPESYTLLLEGKGGPGFVNGTARVQLLEKGAQTELHYESDVQVGGMIAAIGSRLVEAAARKLSDDFFKKFKEQVEKPDSSQRTG
jgi:carbon monoxide dehydrogenase subunit G